MNYVIDPVKTGTTFNGLTFQILLEETGGDIPLNITDYIISFHLFLKCNEVTKLEIGSGITITDAITGQFRLDPFLVTFNPDIYQYYIKTVSPSGESKIYIEGSWKIVKPLTC